MKDVCNIPAISVIMLTYNREGFVGRAVESVLGQSFQDFEMIVVDNGSTDGSAEVCAGFARTDSRLRVIQKEKGNIGSGRNAGLQLAKGEYVAFIDDDDYCMPEFLAFLHGLATTHGADISVCGSYQENEGVLSPNGNYVYDQLYILNAGQAVEKYLWRQLYNCAMPTKLVKRKLFDEIRFPEQGSYDDITTAYKYFANAGKVVAQGLPHYVFRRHDQNNSGAATKHHLLNPAQLQEYLQAFRDRTAYIGGILPELSALARYSEWSYMLSMIEKISRFQLKNCDEPLAEMRAQVKANLDEFLNGGFILDFERDWIREFIG